MAQTPPVVGMAVALARIAAFIPSRGVAAQNLQIAERQRQVRVTRLDVIDIQHDTSLLHPCRSWESLG
jgi:hypothetical protein